MYKVIVCTFQCFVFHFYAGVRAGGGIGDELESPYGDASEYARMLFDISFFFFVIVILLAIMQGTVSQNSTVTIFFNYVTLIFVCMTLRFDH